MSAGDRESAAAEALRRTFDAAFAAPVVASERTIALLSIRVGQEPLALRVADVSSIRLAGEIVPLPGAPAEILGLAGIRGRVLPVYDLGALLGRGAGTGARWLAITGAPSVALAFAAFEGQLLAPEASVVPAAGSDRMVRAVATISGAARAVIDLDAVHAEIVRRAGAARAPGQERGSNAR